MKKNLAYISLAVTTIALLTIVFIRSTEENHQDSYECASYASIIRVEEYDGEKSTVEYYIEIDDNTQALESLTGLEFMSQRNYSSLREISFEEVITEWILIEE